MKFQGRWMLATEFAEWIGAPARTVRYWCQQGYVPARKRGPRVWAIDVNALKVSECELFRVAYERLVLGKDSGENLADMFRDVGR